MSNYNPKYARPTDALQKKHLDKFEDQMIKRYDGIERRRTAAMKRLRALEERVDLMEAIVREILELRR